MTPERIAALRACCTEFVDRVETSDVEECLDEIERLKTLMAESVARSIIVIDRQASHIRLLREALIASHPECGRQFHGEQCVRCIVLAETEPERGYQPRNPTPLDPMTLKPPTGGSAVVEPK